MKKPRKQKPKAKRHAPAQARSRPRVQPERAPTARAHSRSRTRPVATTLRQARHRIVALATSGKASLLRGSNELAHLAGRISFEPIRTRFGRWHTSARSVALPYSRDERQMLLLFFLPFLLVATAIVLHQSVRTLYAYVTLAAIDAPERELPTLRPKLRDAGLPPVTELALASAPAAAARLTDVPHAPLPPTVTAPVVIAATPPAPEHIAHPAAPGAEAQSVVAAAEIRTSAPPIDTIAITAPPPTPASASPYRTLAFLSPSVGIAPATRPPFTPVPVDMFEADADGRPILPGICSIAETATAAPLVTASLAAPLAAAASLDPETFGMRLAHAAEAQAAEAQAQSVVVYDDAYRTISYPMGDVPSMFGVCTDVIVRAYRTLGIDLQTLVHKTRSGRGDRNIDHRRTEVLRRFFATHGESLPVSTFAEDYRPGDIVTYHRPQNRGSRSHIAVVSSELAPSGRPMIVHNRGWGPQLEDALFVDRITGHYRYRGPEQSRDAARGTISPKRAASSSAHAEAARVATAIPASLSTPAN